MRNLAPKLVAACAALVLAALALFGVNLGLKAAGIGAAPPGFESGLKYQRVFMPVMEPGTLADGRQVLRTVDPRLPFQWIEPEKPEDTLRIFCFGGSATAGLGFSPNVTFPRYLERMLEDAWPDHQLEVINLGMVALPAHGVSWMVRNVCASYEPDLLIVYSGNNEFLEIHSEEYFRSTAGIGERVKHDLERSNLWNLMRGNGSGDRPTITSRDLAANDKRVNHKAMLEKISLSADQELKVLDDYTASIEVMAAAARAANVPMILCNVATNTEWWAMDDIDMDWLTSDFDDDLEAALASTDEAIAQLDRHQGHQAHQQLYRRGVLLDRLGDLPSASVAFTAARDADPHQRRATSAHAERVQAAAQAKGVHLFDAIAYLEQRNPKQRIGFNEFYDYVHFTPKGAMALSTGLIERIQELSLLPPFETAALESFQNGELARLSALTEDHLAIGLWTGTVFDPTRIATRDLWKYDRAQDEVDARLKANPEDARALAHQANARFFEVSGLQAAESSYRASLAIEENPTVRANLETLLSDRRP